MALVEYRPLGSAEWQPAGVTESIVAERLVNITWRLERAQRMQNQIIDYLGINELREYRARTFSERYEEAHGVSMQEAGVGADHLLLGEPIAAPLADSVKVVAILEAAARSMSRGGTVEAFHGD